MEKLTFKRCEVKFNFGDRYTHTPQIVALLWTVIETKGRVHVKKSKKLWKFSSLGCPPLYDGTIVQFLWSLDYFFRPGWKKEIFYPEMPNLM